MSKEGKNIWEVFQEETGIHYYFFESNHEKNSFKVYPNPLTEEEKQKVSLEYIAGIFVSKGPLFDDCGKYIGKPFFPFVRDMQSFERDNHGEFLSFESIVLNHKFEGDETNWYQKFKEEFFPFQK
jgi:hypothetical protein